MPPRDLAKPTRTPTKTPSSASPVAARALKIGELAGCAEVSVDAIRFYERRGILPRPQRRASGYRIFGESDVARIRMTKRLQRLGLSLSEIVDALKALQEPSVSCEGERWRLEAVLQRIDAKLAELQETRRAVIEVLAACRDGACDVVPAAKKGLAAPRAGRSRRG